MRAGKQLQTNFLRAIGFFSLGSFQAAILLPVNVCHANRCNVWWILELRFTFEEGACSRLTDFDRTFEWKKQSRFDACMA